MESLRAVDLIRGGSLENAIVLTRDGILNGELRYPDEFGRHKTLDLIGDLALIGRPLLARVVAHKAGHALHTQLVSRLLADPSLWVEPLGRDPAEKSPPRSILRPGPRRFLSSAQYISDAATAQRCMIRPPYYSSSAPLSKAGESSGQ